MAQGDITIHKHNEYEFICWYWETSNAWGHEVRLCKTGEQGGVELGRARVRYYNRTWEYYTYQSAMAQALENYKKQELERFIERYKYDNKLKYYDMEETHDWVEKPLPRGMKKKLTEEFNAQPLWQELEEYVKRGRD